MIGLIPFDLRIYPLMASELCPEIEVEKLFS